ncbi:MAG TPA: hypothetical protein VMS12_09180, partial [Thermoanaerobaculia bacterium]|nr:hypothetical protein [Thermoanaerobaculia bacterium]
RRRVHRNELLAILAIVAVFLAFNLSFVDWHAGWSVGPRYIIPIIPFLGLLMLYATSIMRPLWVLLGAIAFANNLAAVAVNHLISIDYKNPLADYIYPVLLSGVVPRFVEWPPHVPPGSGHVAINTESVAVPPLAGPWGSFNLGEFVFGVGDPRSLLPILFWLALGSLFLYRQTRNLPSQ